MAWRVAKALDQLLAQINALAPRRSKASDGSIGDKAHQKQGNKSDHNPWFVLARQALVTARDYTHDPAAGANMGSIAEALRQSRDKRIKYVIWNKRIFSSYATATRKAWEWGPYSGSNPHTKHMHVSVVASAAADSPAVWVVLPGGVVTVPVSTPTTPPRDWLEELIMAFPTQQRGSKGLHAKIVQALLIAAGYNVQVDGDFGPKTDAAVRSFQRAKGLVADGEVGPKTLRKLLGQ